MGLYEHTVPRSYHLQDNDWTPLSQNLCWKTMIYLFSVFTRSDRLRPNTKINRLSGTENNKSFVDDFVVTEYCTRERWLVLRSAEVKLLSRRFVSHAGISPRTPQKHNTPSTKKFSLFSQVGLGKWYSVNSKNLCPRKIILVVDDIERRSVVLYRKKLNVYQSFFPTFWVECFFVQVLLSLNSDLDHRTLFSFFIYKIYKNNK